MSKNWITVASFSQPFEAHLAKTRLEAEEITCVVSDEYLVRVDWLLSNAVGGVKLMVPVWEAERAKEILRPRPRLMVVAQRRIGRRDDLPALPLRRRVLHALQPARRGRVHAAARLLDSVARPPLDVQTMWLCLEGTMIDA